MYAAIVRLTIDPERASEAARAFTNEILPRIEGSPGFIAGYWVDPVEEEGLGFVLFETKDHARRVTPESVWAAPGVEIREVAIRRVAVAIP